jgi:polyisoprenoid-binding protein YceI
MKTILALALAITTSAYAQKTKEMNTTYKVDTDKTKINWEGTKVTGKHHGTIKAKSGSLVFKGAELAGGEIIVDMNSITVTDLETDPATMSKFLGHMKSPDFFNTEKYPESKLVIKSTKKVGNDLDVMGELTMVGKTAPVTFKVTDWKWTENMVTGKSSVKVDRTKWGLKYGSGQFFKGLGDKMIHDEFTLNIDLTATR